MTLARRFHPSRPAIAVALAAILLIGCAGAPKRPDTIARDDYGTIERYVSQLIRHEMNANTIEGMSIALVDDQRIVWAAGFGHADKERQRPATAETIYRVGSISKLFTATAAMQLAEQKKLDLDRPLQDYLPDFSVPTRFPAAAAITPRNLMSHHSGLPRDVVKGMFTKNPAPFTQLIQDIKSSDAAYPPNEAFSYSNVGVSLLGHAIQEASGMAFTDYVRSAVLDPLGMKGATMEAGPGASTLMSKAYRKGEVVDELPLRDIPAGGLNASAIDLGRFLSMVFAEGRAGDRRLLRPESVAEMLRPQNATVALDLDFHTGLGWMLSTLGGSSLDNAGPVAHHNGATVHFHASLYALPAYKLGVIVLANSGTAGGAVDRVAREALALALEAKTGIAQTKHPEVAAADPPWPRERLETYVGDYTTPFGLVRIRLASDHLRADALGRRFRLIPRADGLLGLEYRLLGLLPIDLGPLKEIGLVRRNVAGRDALIASAGMQEMLLGERIRTPEKSEAWLKRLGSYEIADAGDDHTFVDRLALIEEEGLLIGEITPTGQFPPPLRLVLQPLSDNEAILLGPLADRGETLRCQPGDGGQCTFSGYILRRNRQ